MSIVKLSISSIRQFKACRRAYQLRSVYRIIPAETTEALATGSNYHALIEDIHKTGIIPDIIDKETAMANAYAKYILPDMPEFEPEVWFEKRIHRGKILVGRTDGKAENAIVEHKTTSLNLDEYEFNLQWDEQLLAYFIGNECNTAYYTMCKKPTIRQKQNESDAEFAQRCYEWYEEDTFDKIRLVKVTRTAEELDAYKQELVKIFQTIQSAHRSDNFYRNPCNCKVWGRMCEYAPICLNYNPDNEYVGFKKRG